MSITRCPHCGTANRAGSNFCNGCGTDLREEEQARSAPATSPPGLQDGDYDEYAGDAADFGEDLRDETGPAAHARTRTTADTPPAVPPERPTSPSPTGADELPTAPDPDAPDLSDQPWLWLEFDSDDEAGDTGFSDTDVNDTDVNDDDATAAYPQRLITGVQGLLNPIRVSTNISDDDEPVAAPSATAPIGLAPETLRIVRGLMGEPPPIRNRQPGPPDQVRKLRIPWIFALVGLAVGLPALLMFAGPGGIPHQWPGVEAAYRTVQAVAPDTLVVVYWAYDPATAGEMDLMMQPVVRHLLERRARLAIVSTLPGGPATARRLIDRIRTPTRPGDLAAAVTLAQPVTYTYLPGGAAVLPLLARAPVQGMIEAPLRADPSLQMLLVRRPGLVVVAAAQAEDVQDWLEQVQPLQGSTVIAVTAAGVDPIVRPYLDSGQLRGLVSGFDGAYHYQHLREPFTAPIGNDRLLRQVAWQNWGHLAFIAAIILGNLAALLGRETAE